MLNLLQLAVLLCPQSDQLFYPPQSSNSSHFQEIPKPSTSITEYLKLTVTNQTPPGKIAVIPIHYCIKNVLCERLRMLETLQLVFVCSGTFVWRSSCGCCFGTWRQSDFNTLSSSTMFITMIMAKAAKIYTYVSLFQNPRSHELSVILTPSIVRSGRHLSEYL